MSQHITPGKHKAFLESSLWAHRPEAFNTDGIYLLHVAWERAPEQCLHGSEMHWCRVAALVTPILQPG